MKDNFKLKILPRVETFVGLRFAYAPDNGIFLEQENRIEKLAKKYKLEDMKSRTTPISNKELNNIGEKQLDDPKLYQSIVGTINYFSTVSRPDVTFATNYLSRHLQKPTKTMLTKARRVLKYIYGTKKKR
eukprot:snap_masked-scaffold_41-processed-gene-2.52-mRNA-1 protein AED:0.42 eAED:0.43 QI:0/-1/0/1/-1/1/1/0/129